ncbi:MAG: hypothetical protein KAX31_01840, partial [Thermoplasmata archaeon]|nr:hypothetical protein [Thermoplasmata archaeon]
MESGSALYMCPHCGAFIAEDVSVCPNCKKPLDTADEENIEMELEALIEEEESPEADIESPDETGEPDTEGGAVTLYLCSECGAFTASGSEKCSSCGATLIEEPEDKEPVPEPEKLEPETPVPEPSPEDEIVDMLVVDDEEGAKEPAHEEVTDDEVEDDESAEDDALLEGLKKLESPEDVESFIELIDEVEDVEDTAPEPEEAEPVEDIAHEIAQDIALELAPEPEAEEDLDKELEDIDDILSMLVYTDDDVDKETKRADAIEAVETIIAEEPAAEAIRTERLGICSKCGAFAAEGQDKCGVCGASLEGDAIILPGAETETPAESAEPEAGAREVLSKILGVSEDAELAPTSSRFDEDGRLSMCTVCGAFLGSDFEKCGICGTRVEDMPEFVPSMEGVEED